METEHHHLAKQVETLTHALEERTNKYRKSVFHRFPFLLIGLSTYGLVAVLYGFEKLIDTIPLLADNPVFVLGSGLFALAITGTLYKKLR